MDDLGQKKEKEMLLVPHSYLSNRQGEIIVKKKKKIDRGKLISQPSDEKKDVNSFLCIRI